MGAEIQPVDGLPVVLWAKNRRGYANLCQLITKGRRRATKGACEIHLDEIAEHSSDLLAGVVPPSLNEACSIADVACYRDIFGDSARLLLQLHRGPHDDERLRTIRQLSRNSRLPLVAAGNVIFHIPDRKPLHDVLTAIHHHTTVAQTGEYLQPNAERHIGSLSVLEQVPIQAPEALERTIEIADQCTFSLEELRYEYPEELAPEGQTPLQHLKQLTWQGANERYPNGIPEKVSSLLTHEFGLIEELRYEPYFLTVHDLVRFAR